MSEQKVKMKYSQQVNAAAAVDDDVVGGGGGGDDDDDVCDARDADDSVAGAHLRSLGLEIGLVVPFAPSPTETNCRSLPLPPPPLRCRYYYYYSLPPLCSSFFVPPSCGDYILVSSQWVSFPGFSPLLSPLETFRSHSYISVLELLGFPIHALEQENPFSIE